MPDPNEKNKLDEVEKGIDDVVEKMGLGDKVADLSDDLVDQMENSMMSRLYHFKFPLGTEVKNRHNETGYIEMCAIDFRGEIYLINFKDNYQRWLTSIEIKIVEDASPMYSDDKIPPLKSLPKSDFPEKMDI
jgi:hypothetical protein